MADKVLTGPVHVSAPDPLPGQSPAGRAAQPLLPHRPDDGGGGGGDGHGGVSPRRQGQVRHQRSV